VFEWSTGDSDHGGHGSNETNRSTDENGFVKSAEDVTRAFSLVTSQFESKVAAHNATEESPETFV
jgi:hypothetical protein